MAMSSPQSALQPVTSQRRLRLLVTTARASLRVQTSKAQPPLEDCVLALSEECLHNHPAVLASHKVKQEQSASPDSLAAATSSIPRRVCHRQHQARQHACQPQDATATI